MFVQHIKVHVFFGLEHAFSITVDVEAQFKPLSTIFQINLKL